MTERKCAPSPSPGIQRSAKVKHAGREKKNHIGVSLGYFGHTTLHIVYTVFLKFFTWITYLLYACCILNMSEICFSIFCHRGRTPWSNCGSCPLTGASLYTQGQGWQERCSMGHRLCLTTQRTTVSIPHDIGWKLDLSW